MKKLFLGVLLGFFLNNATHTFYDWTWWNAEASEKCRAIKDFDQSNACIYNSIGVVKYLAYPLAYYTYQWQEWTIQYP